MTPRSLDRLLEDARPAGPRGRAAESVAVRVLARVAALEALGESAGPARRSPTGRKRRVARGAAAAVGALAVVASAAVGVAGVFSRAHRADGPETAAARPLEPATEDATSAASSSVSTANGSTSTAASTDAAREPSAVPVRTESAASEPTPRERWLAVAESGGGDAVDALRAFARAGGPAGRAEARRVAALHAAPTLAPVVREVLAGAAGDAGPAALADLLLSLLGVPESGGAGAAAAKPSARRDEAGERAVVRALETVADAGREALALDGLRRAADAGSFEAALACARRAGAADLDRVLAVLAVAGAADGAANPLAESSAGAPERARLADLVAAQPRALGGALLRRAARGDSLALSIAVLARLDGAIEVLRPQLADPWTATDAAATIASIGGPLAWDALAAAMEGGVGPASSAALSAASSLPAEAADHFAAAAVREAGAGAAPYLAALAAMDERGLARLETLAERPALSVAVVRAIASSSAPRASDVLSVLGCRPALALPAVEALTTRLEAGDATASVALLALARGRTPRAALGALAAAGPAGEQSLGRALADPRLRGQAEAALRRESSPSAPRPAGLAASPPIARAPPAPAGIPSPRPAGGRAGR